MKLKKGKGRKGGRATDRQRLKAGKRTREGRKTAARCMDALPEDCNQFIAIAKRNNETCKLTNAHDIRILREVKLEFRNLKSWTLFERMMEN